MYMSVGKTVFSILAYLLLYVHTCLLSHLLGSIYDFPYLCKVVGRYVGERKCVPNFLKFFLKLVLLLVVHTHNFENGNSMLRLNMESSILRVKTEFHVST